MAVGNRLCAQFLHRLLPGRAVPATALWNLPKPDKFTTSAIPNALMTLKEYLEDYASQKPKAIGDQVIAEQLPKITDPTKHRICAENLKKN